MPPAKFSYLPPERYGLWASEYAAAATRPLGIVRRNWLREAPYMLALFFGIFLFYGITTSSAVGLEDDGLFISNLHFFGVAHPPGYPAHTFLGGIFYHLFSFGTPAFRAHLFSGFAGAAACVALYAITAMLAGGRLFPLLAALAYAVSKTFWSQAIVAEVYTLNAALFFIVMALAMHAAAASPPRPRALYAAAAVSGLALANHYPLFLLGASGLALLVLPRLIARGGRSGRFGKGGAAAIWRTLPACAGIAVFTALPFYLWMIWRSYQPLPANFYAQPISTLDEFSYYLLRQGYSSVDQQSGVNWDDKLAFLKTFAEDFLWQYTPLGFALIVLGFLVMSRTRYNWLWLCMLVSFLCNSAVLLIALNFQAGHVAFAVFRVYYLLAYGLAALWLAVGAAWLVDRLGAAPFAWRRLAGGALAAAVIGGAAAAHWQVNYRAADTWAEDLARTKLGSIEPNSILFMNDDLDLPAMYLHFVTGLRPDLTVYHDQGLLLPNRLYSPFLPDYPPPNNPQQPSVAALLHQFIAQARAPIYYNSVRYQLFSSPTVGSEFLGFYRRANTAEPGNKITLHDSVKTWLQKNLDGSIIIHDPWTRFQQYETISSVMNAVVQAAEEGSVDRTDGWDDIIRTAREKNAKVRVLTNLILIGKMTPEQLRQEAAWLDSFDLTSEPLMDKFGRGRFYLLRARIEEELNGISSPRYRQSLLSALEQDERLQNPGVSWLLAYYASNPTYYCDYLSLIEHYYADTDQIPPAYLTQLREIRKTAVC